MTNITTDCDVSKFSASVTVFIVFILLERMFLNLNVFFMSECMFLFFTIDVCFYHCMPYIIYSHNKNVFKMFSNVSIYLIFPKLTLRRAEAKGALFCMLRHLTLWVPKTHRNLSVAKSQTMR